MFTDNEIKGNTCVYFLFQICNIALTVLGFFTIAIAIYLIALSKSLNIFNSLFIIFGIMLIILSFFGCKLRLSPSGNLIYSIILTVIFFCDLIVTIVLINYREHVIKWIMENYDSQTETIEQVNKIVNRNVNTVNDLLLLIVMLFFLVVVLSWLYRRSLMERQAEWNRSMLTYFIILLSDLIMDFENKKNLRRRSDRELVTFS